MSQVNSHSLSRDIPEPIKREVRIKYGFGCVICGLGIFDYEHIDPEFKDAKEHNPECITLLCPQCHAKKTRKWLSIETVKAAMKNPKCLEVGFSKEVFDIGKGYPIIEFAGSLIEKCPVPISVDGRPLFRIDPPEIEGGPFLLSGRFFDSSSQLSLEIVKNEWRAKTNNWDVEVVGGTIIIRESKGNIHLLLSANPPDKITIEKINMTVGNWNIEGNKNDFIVKDVSTGNSNKYTSCISSNNPIGFAFG